MNQRIKGLDGLRGVAAAVVLIHHCMMLSPGVASAYVADRARGPVIWVLLLTPLRTIWAGSEAVWVFFVLSGFVLTRRHFAGEPLDARSYYPRRITRLYLPVLGSAALAIAARLVRHRAVPGGSEWLNYHAAGISTRGASSSLLLVLGNKVVLNSVWWSLQWEVLFSLLLPIVVLAGLRVRHQPVLVGVACLITAAVGPAIVNGRVSGFVLGAVTCLPIFGIGVALAAAEERLVSSDVFERRPELGWLALAGCVGGLTVAAPIFAVTRALAISGRAPGIVATAITMTAAGGFVALALTFGPFTRFLSHRSNLWLGVRSYSLYLVHEPVLVSLAFAFRLHSWPLWFPVVGIGASLLVTMAFYRVVERPSVRLSQRVGRLAATPA